MQWKQCSASFLVKQPENKLHIHIFGYDLPSSCLSRKHNNRMTLGNHPDVLHVFFFVAFSSFQPLPKAYPCRELDQKTDLKSPVACAKKEGLIGHGRI